MNGVYILILYFTPPPHPHNHHPAPLCQGHAHGKQGGNDLKYLMLQWGQCIVFSLQGHLEAKGTDVTQNVQKCSLLSRLMTAVPNHWYTCAYVFFHQTSKEICSQIINEMCLNV